MFRRSILVNVSNRPTSLTDSGIGIRLSGKKIWKLDNKKQVRSKHFARFGYHHITQLVADINTGTYTLKEDTIRTYNSLMSMMSH